MVRYGHVTVGGRRVDIPSYVVESGQTVRIVGSEPFLKSVKETCESVKDRPLPPWLNRHAEQPEGTIVGKPGRGDVQFPIQEQLIVELYSR